MYMKRARKNIAKQEEGLNALSEFKYILNAHFINEPRRISIASTWIFHDRPDMIDSFGSRTSGLNSGMPCDL